MKLTVAESVFYSPLSYISMYNVKVQYVLRQCRIYNSMHLILIIRFGP